MFNHDLLLVAPTLFVSVQYWTKSYKPSIGPFVPQGPNIGTSILKGNLPIFISNCVF